MQGQTLQSKIISPISAVERLIANFLYDCTLQIYKQRENMISLRGLRKQLIKIQLIFHDENKPIFLNGKDTVLIVIYFYIASLKENLLMKIKFHASQKAEIG